MHQKGPGPTYATSYVHEGGIWPRNKRLRDVINGPRSLPDLMVRDSVVVARRGIYKGT